MTVAVLATLAVIGASTQAAATEGPWWTQETTVTGEGEPSFGLAVEARERIAFVSATPDEFTEVDGNVSVVERSGLTWNETQELDPPDGRTPGFGQSLALDGDRIAVGDVTDDGRGSAHVFAHEGDAWTHEAELPNEAARIDDQFGRSIALAGDIAVVGAPNEDGEAEAAGAVHVYESTTEGWTHVHRLTAPDAHAWQRFGSSLALENGTLAVGAPGYDGPDGDQDRRGAVYLYEDVAGQGPSPERILHPEGGQADAFGTSVDLDRGRLAAGAPGSSDDGKGPGAVLLFTPGSDNWTRDALIKSDNYRWSDEFGNSLDLKGDRLAVGNERGDVRLFNGSSDWTQQDRVIVGSSDSDVRCEACVEDVAIAANATLAGMPWQDRPDGGVDGVVAVLGPDREPDGLSDREEAALGTDPTDPDTDDDRLEDPTELRKTKTDPADADTDGDGIRDDRDDRDGDELANRAELEEHGTDPVDADTDGDALEDGRELRDTGTDPRNDDTDDDWLSDGSEVLTHGTDPLVVDTDGDHLDDRVEVDWAPTDPLAPDTEGDGLRDGEELFEFETEPLASDTDQDGLPDGEEVDRHRSDPTRADSDGDGFDDDEEVANGSHPYDPASRPTPAGPSPSTLATWRMGGPSEAEGAFAAPDRGHVTEGSSSRAIVQGGGLLTCGASPTTWVLKAVYRPTDAVLELEIDGESQRIEDGRGTVTWVSSCTSTMEEATVTGVDVDTLATYDLTAARCENPYCQAKYHSG